MTQSSRMFNILTPTLGINYIRYGCEVKSLGKLNVCVKRTGGSGCGFRANRYVCTSFVMYGIVLIKRSLNRLLRYYAYFLDRLRLLRDLFDSTSICSWKQAKRSTETGQIWLVSSRFSIWLDHRAETFADLENRFSQSQREFDTDEDLSPSGSESPRSSPECRRRIFNRSGLTLDRRPDYRATEGQRGWTRAAVR